MEKKFTALRVIATLYKIAGVLIALGTVLFVVMEIVGEAAATRFCSIWRLAVARSWPL